MSFLPIKNIYYSKFEQIPNITSNIINDIIKSIENFTIQYSNEEDIIIEDYINTIFESKIKDILKLLLNNSDIINNISKGIIILKNIFLPYFLILSILSLKYSL